MKAYWYVLHSKPRRELFLVGELLARNIETFCPLLYLKPVNPRARKIKPYFPGYLFVHIDLQSTNISSLSWMPGVSGLVSFGVDPAFVPNELIDVIRKKVDRINRVGSELPMGLQAGDKVLVEDGPFAGYQGVFDSRLPGDDRVRILLDLLKQRQMRVDLPVAMVKRVDVKG
jgi:transcription antitermination factor NusG